LTSIYAPTTYSIAFNESSKKNLVEKKTSKSSKQNLAKKNLIKGIMVEK
jgi:adenosine/AMP kinase